LVLVLSCFLLFTEGACSRAHHGVAKLPTPSLSTVVGPGDVFEVYVLGEKEIPKEFRIQPDGTIDFPYLDRITVAGLEPQQIEELLKRELVERRILVSPQVTLIVKQYNSKKVSVVGAVQ
jgi:polysaccharide export outer membrane protein